MNVSVVVRGKPDVRPVVVNTSMSMRLKLAVDRRSRRWKAANSPWNRAIVRHLSAKKSRPALAPGAVVVVMGPVC